MEWVRPDSPADRPPKEMREVPLHTVECRSEADLPGEFAALGLQLGMETNRSPPKRTQHPYCWWPQCEKLPP